MHFEFATELMEQLWFQLVFTLFFAFLTGLEFRQYLANRETLFSIGTTRTFTFIALLGFVLYHLDQSYHLFMLGMIAIIALMALFYYQKLLAGSRGILQLIIGLCVYTYGPVCDRFPPWVLILLFVSIVFVLGTRPFTRKIASTIDQQEITTLAKFLLLSAVILPLLPQSLHVDAIPATPFQIWVAVVVISSISYLGYILTRYFFRQKGYLITGLLGGLYSSTATTVVLSRKVKPLTAPSPTLQAAIVSASGMMYFRLLLLVLILHPAYLKALWLPFVSLGLAAFATAIFFMKQYAKNKISSTDQAVLNPLELGTAMVFAVIFVIMLILTNYITEQFGTTGLKLLAFGVGFTDIDPFVLSLLKGSFQSVSAHQICGALVIATGSNNFLKGIYAVALGGWNNKDVMIILFVLGGLSLLFGLMLFQ